MAPVGEIELCYETFGAAGSPPLLLIMGLASQMLMWDDDFCEQLAARGFRVIRFDNRDVGHSTHLRGAKTPKRWHLLLRSPRGAAYTLDEMADDAVGLLDHLEISAAHVVGASMGGMIAQLMTITHPDRVLSLVSIMSTTGARDVGRTQPRVARRLLRRAARERDAYIEEHIGTYRLIGSPDYPFDEGRQRERAARLFERGVYPAGSARQLGAVTAAGDRTERLRAIQVPTTVIHGDADPLVDVSGGRATADAIPGATLLIIPGMGHDLPRELWPQIIDAIAANAGVAATPGSGA
ncbi:MAG TPA: alpha/beta fold hydrolase [Solirubrobacteraceae bacterium]|jgi:pimeloyl-ACP methyl ester carboxylesterase|nr:alpha/beta fold hydrolase [Solirubrobacteraceae bacterium]